MRILPIVMACMIPAAAAGAFESDRFETSAGSLTITFIGHGSLMMTWNGRVIQVDPYSALADYGQFQTADLILLTHAHPDHLDTAALSKVRSPATTLVQTEACARQVPGGIVMKNGDEERLLDITIEAVPAYNLVHMREGGVPYHPKGEGNGYVLTFGDLRVYIAGDTENIPEMATLSGIDVAFLPMNLPYTMTPEMTAAAARSFNPKILYPYHFGSTDPAALQALLRDTPAIDVRIRKMQ